jgi:7,8-dihydroneopterin 2',3'-cyclic phosphate phosphodiesterase
MKIAEMKKLLELADRIEDKELRKKVVDVLKYPDLSNKEFKYPAIDLNSAPASVNWHHVQSGGLIEHTYSVSLLVLSVAEIIEKVYKIPVNKDVLLAAALIHDIGKLWGIRKIGGKWEANELTIDHTVLGTAELYSRGFPESVIHVVASHFGDQGPTPPQTIEAVIFHYVDSLDAVIGTVKQDNIIELL